MGNITGGSVKARDGDYVHEVNEAAQQAIGEMLDKDLSSRVEISLRSKSLRKKCSSQAVLYMKPATEDSQWQEWGRTEVQHDSSNPRWVKSICVDYSFEKQQRIRVEVYQIKSESKNLSAQTFLGSCQCYLAEIVAGSNAGFSRDLEHHLRRQKGANGTIQLLGEEMSALKYNCTFGMRGSKLLAMNFPSCLKSDPYVTVSRTQGDSAENEVPVYKTEVKKGNLNPTYDRAELTVQSLCRGEQDRPIAFEVFDWNMTQASEPMGKGFTTYEQIKKGFERGQAVEVCLTYVDKKGKSISAGSIWLEKIDLQREYSFLDYITGGLEIALVVGIDFTLSNGDPRFDTSLHHLNLAAPNDYVQAIRAVGEILQYYDADKKYPVYGFGAKLPPAHQTSSHCFSLKGDFFDPEVDGIDGIIEAYRLALEEVTLHGPTNFNEIVRLAADMAAPHSVLKDGDDPKYVILLIVTDGVINDMEKTINQIVRASEFPMSIIIVGVGNEDFSLMDKLDADEEKLWSTEEKKYMERDIVQFVPFNDFKDRSYMELALATLDEVPREVVNYFQSRGVKPNLDKPPKEEEEDEESEGGFDCPPALQEAKRRMLAHGQQQGFSREEIEEVFENGIQTSDPKHLVEILEFRRKLAAGDPKDSKQNNPLVRQSTLNEFNSVAEGTAGAWAPQEQVLQQGVSAPLAIPGTVPEQEQQQQVVVRAKKKKKNAGSLEDEDEMLCKVCFEKPIDTVILECGHRVVCQGCSGDLGPICPLCRQTITRIMKTYGGAG